MFEGNLVVSDENNWIEIHQMMHEVDKGTKWLRDNVVIMLNDSCAPESSIIKRYEVYIPGLWILDYNSSGMFDNFNTTVRYKSWIWKGRPFAYRIIEDDDEPGCSLKARAIKLDRNIELDGDYDIWIECSEIMKTLRDKAREKKRKQWEKDRVIRDRNNQLTRSINIRRRNAETIKLEDGEQRK